MHFSTVLCKATTQLLCSCDHELMRWVWLCIILLSTLWPVLYTSMIVLHLPIDCAPSTTAHTLNGLCACPTHSFSVTCQLYVSAPFMHNSAVIVYANNRSLFYRAQESIQTAQIVTPQFLVR